MRLTKKNKDGSYSPVLNDGYDGTITDKWYKYIADVIQKLGKYEDQFEDPDFLKDLNFCCCLGSQSKE